jgi:hypothetical protein
MKNIAVCAVSTRAEGLFCHQRRYWAQSYYAGGVLLLRSAEQQHFSERGIFKSRFWRLAAFFLTLDVRETPPAEGLPVQPLNCVLTSLLTAW